MGVPLALHLVMRRQPRHLEFPALRFIKQRESANRRQLKLRHLLLLALRMALMLLLAAALARPSLQGSGWLGDQEAPVAAALVFDTSPRMEYRHHNQTRLESARETGLWLLSQLPRDSEVAVIDSRYGSEARAFDLLAAKNRIERLKPSPVGSPLATTFGDALRLLRETTKQRKEVYVFTDLARSNWSPQATESLRKQLADESGTGLYLIDVGVEEPQNFGITDLRLSSEAVSKGVPLVIQVELVARRRDRPSAPSNSICSTRRRRPASAARKSSASTSTAAAQAEFQLRGLEPGLHQGYVKIAGEDALAADDTRYFTVDVTPAWKVLLASPKPTDDYTLFLSEAIAPYALRIKGAAAFRCDTVPLDNLLKKPLAEYAAVCLLDPTPLTDDAWRQLAAYASGGGGVAIFLGRRAQPIDSFNQEAAQQLLPGKLLRESRDETYLAPENLEHPLLAKFRPLESSIPWDAFPVYKYWTLGPLNPGAGVVIPYANTLPALVDRPLGRGRVLTHDHSGVRCLRPQRSLEHAADRRRTLAVRHAGQRDDVLPGRQHPLEAELSGRRNGGGAPGRRSAPQHLFAHSAHRRSRAAGGRRAAKRDRRDRHRSGGQLSAECRRRNTGHPARLQRQSARGAEPLRAGHARRAQSRVRRTPFRVARSRDEIVRDVNFGRVGRELYPLLIVLLVLALAGEQLLANRFYRPGNQQVRSAAASFAHEREASRQPSAESAIAPGGGPPSDPLAADSPPADVANPQSAVTP